MGDTPPRAKMIAAAADVPECPDCGAHSWLDGRCLRCPTGVAPWPARRRLGRWESLVRYYLRWWQR